MAPQKQNQELLKELESSFQYGEKFQKKRVLPDWDLILSRASGDGIVHVGGLRFRRSSHHDFVYVHNETTNCYKVSVKYVDGSLWLLTEVAFLGKYNTT